MDSSRELSALLDEDNSDDGHRLAAYLIRKQGISRPQRVFGDYEPRRVSSFKIRLQKIKPTEEAQDAVINAQQPEEATAKDAEKQDACTVKRNADTEKQDADTEKQDADTEKQDADTEKQDARTEKPIPLAENQEKQINNPAAATDTAVKRNSPIPVPKSPHSATLRSPSQRLSVRKSGGLPSADRLRRYSMKRLSTISTSGRRTLLKEFDSLVTDSDFLPNYCSTPMSQNPSAPISPKTPTKQSEAAVLIDKNKTLIPTVNENSNLPECPPDSEEKMERLLTRLNKHDKILTELLDNDPNTINQNLEESLNRIPTTPSSKQNLSPSRSSMRHRTYNIEKGAQPGQVILTPIKTSNANNVPCATTPNRQHQDANDEQYPRPDNPIEEALYTLCTGKTSEKTLTTAPCKSPLLASPKVLQILQRISGKKQPQMTTELISIKKSKIPSRIPLRTPLNKVEHPIQELLSTPIVAEQIYDISDVEIPETQEDQRDVSKLPGTPLRPTTTNELLQSLQHTKSPLVIYQTFNQLPQQTESHLGVEGAVANSSKMNASAGRSEANVTIDKDNENRVTNKTFNKTKPPNNAVDKSVNTTDHAYNKTIESKPSQSQKHIDTPIKTRAFQRSQNSLANYIEIDDNLRFADIITDDEDETPRPAFSQHQDSNAPLNLAPPPETFIPRRKRKHSTRRQLITTDSNEPKNEMWPPRAHPLTVSRASNRIQHKQIRNTPLNAEPRTPINGEKFAKELKINLARLKNHEILDLRIRNSIGKVFTISGRKSLAERKDVLSKQLELENQIQFEILRRNLEGNDEGLTPIYQEDDQNEGVDDMLQMPPAPDDFRDPTIQSIGIENEQYQQALEEEEKNDSPLLAPYNSSLIDDRSCDRVSFVPPVSRRSSTSNKSKRSSHRVKKSKVPEDVQKYLDVSNNINKHKPSDKSKRHLFSQNSEELSPTRSPEASQRRRTDINIAPPLHLRVDTPSPILSSSQNTSTSRNSASFKSSELIQPLPPPKGFSDDENAIFKKPLPPSTMRNKKQKSTNKKQKKNIVSEEMSGLEPISVDATDANNDSYMFKKPQLPAPKKGRNKKSADNKKNAPIEEEQQVEPISGDAPDANNDDNIFKKPQLPAPKRGRRKKTADNNQQVVHDVAAEPQKDDEHSGLRRSKRGHMPLKNYWSFRSTDPMPLYDVRILEIRKEESRRLREMRKNNTAASIRSDCGYMPIASSTAIKKNTFQNTKKQNTKTSNYLGDTNVTSSASSECSNSSPQKIRRLAVISEPEEYVDRSRQEDERQPNNELSCVAEELNIKFNQLKNASMMTDKDAIMPSSSTSSKTKEQTTKNLRVRVKRVKRVVDHEEETDNATKNMKKIVTKEKVLPTKKSKGKTTKGKGNSDNVPADVPEQQTVDAVVTEPLLPPSRNDSEAFSWLRNISFANSKPGTQKLNIFKEMRCANNLVLSNLEGLEYAYYDNDPDASVSFLRFNAHQMKPAKRAKKFNLQFLVISGKFIFSTNKDEAEFNAGALVTINIGARYSIKNITDKQAILMVFKTAEGDA